MTSMELAYRKAEIVKACADVPPNWETNYTWRLMDNLFRDLASEGVKHQTAWEIVFK